MNGHQRQQRNGGGGGRMMNQCNGYRHQPTQQQPLQPQQQQPMMNMNMMSTMDKNNQLLAGTQSMLDGINQLSAITPISKVKSFQFTPTNNANSQFWPQVPSIDISPRNNPFNGLIDVNAMNTNNASNLIKISRSMLKNTSVVGQREDSPKNNVDSQQQQQLLSAKA